mgnify:CR=1 FL=1
MTNITMKNGGCDCEACAARRGMRPIPSMMAEFGVLYERLMAMAHDCPPERAPSREITITVSEVSLVFMAWLDRMIEHRERGGPRPFGVPIDLDEPADFSRAVRYLTQMLPWSLDNDLTELAHGRHPLLFPPEQDAEDRLH